MSAPLVVNTEDGMVWTLRGARRDGESLYAMAGVCECPPYLMATLTELAVHGIVGSADALPVPVGPEPQPSAELAEALAHSEFLMRDVKRLRARIAELEAERHSTNEVLADAAVRMRADQNRIAELETRFRRAQVLHAKHRDSGHCRHDGEQWPCPTMVALSEGEQPADRLTALLAPSQALREDEPADLRAEDVADILTLAPARNADAKFNLTFRTIELELTATREQWSAWQKALKVDLARTTNRGSFVTSHAVRRGVHVVIRYWPVSSEAGA